VVTAVFAGTGLLIAALSIPIMLRKIPPNLWYGLRTVETLRDENVWYEANARSGRGGVILGMGIALLALLGLPPEAMVLLLLAATLAWAWWSWLYARRISRGP